MFGIHDLTLFVISGLLLNITPGADTLYIVGRSTTQGFRAGAMAALGIGAGCCVHIVAAALGLSAILAASATAFMAVKLVGAAYLLYLGFSLLRSHGRAHNTEVKQPALTPLRSVFAQGVMTNVLNPKVALFFLAFLPQFIEPGAANKVFAFLLLGLVFNVNGLVWNLFVARSAASFRHRLQGNGRVAVWLNRTVGGMFIALGIKLALSEQRT